MKKLLLTSFLLSLVYFPANASVLNIKQNFLTQENKQLLSNAESGTNLEPQINEKGIITFGRANYFYNYSWLSQRRIKESELGSYSPLFLDLLRNSVFARYGRKFVTPELQNYFNSQPWYTPRYQPQQFPANLLSSIEQYNVDTIAKYQQKTGRRYFGNSSNIARNQQNNSSRITKPKPATPIQNTAANSSTNEIWRKAQLIRTIDGLNIVDGLVFSPDRKTLVSSGTAIRVWDLQTGELLNTIENTGREKVESIAISPDGKTLVTGITVETNRQGNKTTKVEAWNLENKELLYRLSNVGNQVVISPDGQTLISGLSPQFEVQLFNLHTGELQQKLISKKIKSDAISVSLSKDGKLLAIRSNIGISELWNIQSQKLIRSMIFPGYYNNYSGRVVISPDNQYLVNNGYPNDGVASNAGYLNDAGTFAQIWNLQTGELVRNLEGHSEDITAITISPNGKILVTGSVDGTIRVINLSTRELIRVFKDMKETRALSFSNDSRTLAAGGTDGKIKIWQIP